ncbi:formate dehydrogenase subunit gamma [Undibacterium arcticum]|uniref:Formate dehydrogenase subunit gamma n=1 Tax=Undibacterium arcticum TaxID=1762892 RepID=A0ABV7F5Y1_9BURK
MKKWIGGLALGVSLGALMTLAADVALAQYDDAAKSAAVNPAPPTAQPAPATTQDSQPAQASQPLQSIESIDILKQNQAERTRDQPGNLAPTYRIIKQGGKNYSSLPALEAGVLIQPKAQFPGQPHATTAGEAWRNYRNGPLTHIGGWLLIAAALGVIAMYLIVGPLRMKQGPVGRLIERFTSFERTVHWTTAISFVVLAVSGLTMLFGKYVMMPLFGHGLFGWLAYACKNLHNFVGPIFAVAIVVTFITFVKDNFPQAADLKWLLKLGGLFNKTHVSAGRFNAGEKLWFWGGLTLLGLIVSGSGLVLDLLVPGLDYTRGNLQIASVIHIVGTVLLITAAFGHIYMGTIGVEGAFDAMATGLVDDEWAREHHDLWYQDIESGKVPRVRTAEGAANANDATGPARA